METQRGSRVERERVGTVDVLARELSALAVRCERVERVLDNLLVDIGKAGGLPDVAVAAAVARLELHGTAVER